jgi:nucleoid-associated protein YgaU
MKQKVIMVVIAIALLGVGAAGSFFVTNSRSKAAITDMQSKMQKAQADSDQRVRGYDMMINTLNNEMQKVQLELDKYKSAAPVSAETPEPAATNTFTSSATPTPVTATTTTPTRTASRQTAHKEIEFERPDGPTGNEGNTILYTIQNGDSLWIIAQKQLGNGSRFKEILKLNPKITAKSNLVVGSKLKLPSK